MASNRYLCDYDKRGMASCKGCKQRFDKGSLRVAKVSPSPFSEDGEVRVFLFIAILVRYSRFLDGFYIVFLM